MFSPKERKPYIHVYSGDPALNTEHEDFHHEAWVDTGEEKHLPCKPGCAPVKFHMRRLTPRELDHLLELHGESGTKATWFGLGLALVKVEPFRVDGRDVEIARTVDDVTGGSRVGDEHLGWIRDHDGGKLWLELSKRLAREEFGDPKS